MDVNCDTSFGAGESPRGESPEKPGNPGAIWPTTPPQESLFPPVRCNNRVMDARAASDCTNVDKRVEAAAPQRDGRECPVEMMRARRESRIDDFVRQVPVSGAG